MVLNEDNGAVVFSGEWKFSSSLKGLVEIQGRLVSPLTLLVNMSRREAENDWDHSRYQNYLALHLDQDKAGFSMKKAGTRVDLSSCLLEVATNTSLGLEPEVVTTYWLSYDRENMVIKYGKGYAMEQTTLLICDFTEGVQTAEEMADKRELWNIFFGLYDPARSDTSLLLYTHQTVGDDPGPLVVVRKDPLVVNPSPFVLDSSRASLILLEAALYTFSSDLPQSVRRLYDSLLHCQLESGAESERGPVNTRLSCAIRSDKARLGHSHGSIGSIMYILTRNSYFA